MAGRLPVARGVIPSTAFCSSCVSRSTLGTGAGATAGLPRYFASDSPGRMISSSGTRGTEGAEPRELPDADCRKCAAVRRDFHIHGTRHLVAPHISREADCGPPGPPCGRPPRAASATASPTATAAAITATVPAPITTPAETLSGTVVSGASGDSSGWGCNGAQSFGAQKRWNLAGVLLPLRRGGLRWERT